jgi:hypothetical protein
VLTYDRRVRPELLKVLKPGGWAHSLVEYGRSGQYALDLQLRGYAGKQNCWATLYVGLTKVVDLHFNSSRGYRLDVNKAWKQYGWDVGWESFRPEFTADDWRHVEAYLERAIPSVGTRFLKEGAVQSAVSAFRSRHLTVVDREAAISFSNQSEKTAITSALAAPLLEAVGLSTERWWTGKPASLGGECDALAVAPDGTLLAIEIKPATATSTIPWAPVQVRHYANLLTSWASATPAAAVIVDGMVEQRAELGLTDQRPTCSDPLLVRPVVAIQRGVSERVIDRMRTVQDRLTAAGHNEPPLEVYLVNLVGRLDVLPL